MKKLIYESEWLYGGQCAVPYFFAVNFASQYLIGGAGGKIFKVACYVTYGRMACGILYKKNPNSIYGDIMRNVGEKMAESVGKELDNVADNLQQIPRE